MGKNMIPIGSILFPLKVALNKTDKNVRTLNWEISKCKNYANLSVFENRQILMPWTLCGLQ